MLTICTDLICHDFPGKELEELRGRLRSILSGAYDQGILEQVRVAGIPGRTGCCGPFLDL